MIMTKSTLRNAACGLFLAAMAAPSLASAATPPPAAGVIRTESAYAFDETVARVKADIAAKGIQFFTEIDQSRLAGEAGIKLGPSKLLVFGNPPLGVQFLTSNPYAGLDWPVRILVTQDADGQVWVAYTDFAFIAERYQIRDRGPAFTMASQVAASIAASAQAK
jgi:uncharacterized protein (DUF302 family)